MWVASSNCRWRCRLFAVRDCWSQLALAHPSAVGAALDVVALEQLSALLAPGLDWPHRLADLCFMTTADTRAAIELGLVQIRSQLDRGIEEAVSAEARVQWLSQLALPVAPAGGTRARDRTGLSVRLGEAGNKCLGIALRLLEVRVGRGGGS